MAFFTLFFISHLSMRMLKRLLLSTNSGSLLFDIFVSTTQNDGAGREKEKNKSKIIKE